MYNYNKYFEITVVPSAKNIRITYTLGIWCIGDQYASTILPRVPSSSRNLHWTLHRRPEIRLNKTLLDTTESEWHCVRMLSHCITLYSLAAERMSCKNQFIWKSDGMADVRKTIRAGHYFSSRLTSDGRTNDQQQNIAVTNIDELIVVCDGYNHYWL